MGTSGSYDFTVNRDQLLKDVLIDLGAVSQEDTPSSAVIEHAQRQLNLMLKAWQSKGLNLWKVRNATLLLQQDTTSYSLGPTSTDHFFLDSELVQTTVKVAITGAGGSNVATDVTDSTGMAASDYIGIELDDGSMHFTTIQSVTDLDTIVITSGVPTGDTASVGNQVFTYTNKAQRPLAILNARIRDSSNFDRPINVVSRQEYLQYGDKFTNGSVTGVYFDPQLTNATLNVYSPNQESSETLKLAVQYPMEDMDAAANDFDFPQEWLMAVKYGLELVLAPAYGVRSEQLKTISALAQMYLEEAMGFDKEQESVYFAPEKNYR